MPIFDSQYPVNSNPAGEDKILTTDTSDSSAVKSVTLTKVQEWLGSISKWVTNGMIADQAVTADKVDLATLPSPKIGVIPGSTFSSTGVKAITGVGFKPKLVKFTVLSDLSPNRSGTGAMTETDQYAVAAAWNASLFANTKSQSLSIMWLNQGSTTPVMAARYSSMNADGFSIEVTTNQSALDVAYEAYP